MNDIQLIGDSILIAFEYDATRVANVKGIATAHALRPGQCYDGSTRTWKLPKRCSADVAKVFFDLKWDDKFRDYMRRSPAKFETADTVLDKHRQTELELFAAQMAENGTSLDAPLPDGRTLRQHQREGVLSMAQIMRLIVGWEMGTGKTLATLVWGKTLYEREGWHTLCVARANLVENWRREASGCGHRVVSIYSHAKIPETHSTPFVLIADEAHDFQNLDSQRTKKLLSLALSPLCHGFIAISGTPMKNGQAKNIFPLLKACRHPLGDDFRAFQKRYCGATRRVFGKAWFSNKEQTRITWPCKRCSHLNDQPWKIYFRKFKCTACAAEADWRTIPFDGGCENELELNAAIRPILLRKKKSECLDLPPKTRITERVEPSAEMMATYRQTLSEAKQRYRDRVKTGEIDKAGEALAILTFVRMAAARAKIDYAVERCREIIDQGSKVVVFSAFKEPVVAVSKALKLEAPYTGDITDQRVKQRLIDDFQAGKAAGFASTIKAGGVGITLTAADYVLLMDRELTPGDNDQAEDRLHRDGQKNAVTAIWLSAFPVDDKIDDMNAEKQKNISSVIDGVKADSARVSAQQVLRELFKD
jgi:SNF2 family DNA or RNA helicase